jgi:glycosyltransferase involved in cell wall biosynthesis
MSIIKLKPEKTVNTLSRIRKYLKDFFFLLIYFYLQDIFFKIKYSLFGVVHRRKGANWGVNFAGYLGSRKGLGEAARSTIKILRGADLPLAVINIEHRWMKSTQKPITDFCARDNPYSINILQVNADMVPPAANQLGVRWFKGRYNIGYWFWELERFPKKWNSSFKYFDEIWTASDFCRSAIAEHSPIPVVVIPPSIEVTLNFRYEKSAFGLDEECFVFLYIFDTGSGYERKNPLGAVEAFRKAFKGYKKKDVCLMLKCAVSKETRWAYREIVHAAEGLPVRVIDSVMDRDELCGLMYVSDCYVSPHRSEGFGLTIGESMDLGKPAIATGYSGNLEFMNESNSLLAKYSMKKLERNFGPYKKGNWWAEPQIDHVAELMRMVYEDRKRAREIGMAGSEYIKRNFSSGALKSRVDDRLEQIRTTIMNKLHPGCHASKTLF